MGLRRQFSSSRGFIRLVFLLPFINHYFFLGTGAYLFLEAASPFTTTRRHLATTMMGSNAGNNNPARTVSKARGGAFGSKESSVVAGKGARVKVLDRKKDVDVPGVAPTQSQKDEGITLMPQSRGGASTGSAKKLRAEPSVVSIINAIERDDWATYDVMLGWLFLPP